MTEFMQRALELALKGQGHVSPNPMVGCVIVKDGEIIGEGWHEKYGGPHAEVNAVRSLEDEAQVEGSTVYVTLEPCSHHGKTPPCADLLARLKPKKVVVCNVDPNPLVAGRGLKKLSDVGIEVETGLLEKEGLALNKRFFTAMTKKRPYVILKWAQTEDGFIAREDYTSKWISGENSRELVHQYRAEEDSILVGTNTARYDNPSLNVRFDIEGKDPLRIVIDRNLELSGDLKLFDGSQPTICYNTQKNETGKNLEFKTLNFEEELFPQILENLLQRGIHSIFVEGGRFLINKIIEAGLWDEARVFTGKVKFGKGIEAPKINLAPSASMDIGEDRLTLYSNSEYEKRPSGH